VEGTAVLTGQFHQSTTFDVNHVNICGMNPLSNNPFVEPEIITLLMTTQKR
jgi:hypothetical protein